jgi:hypothetical protein
MRADTREAVKDDFDGTQFVPTDFDTGDEDEEIPVTRLSVTDSWSERALSYNVSLVAVIAGTLSDPDQTPATLLVTEFKMFSKTKAKRYTDIEITYSIKHEDSHNSSNSQTSGPMIADIAPSGYFSISYDSKSTQKNLSTEFVHIEDVPDNSSAKKLWKTENAASRPNDAKISGDMWTNQSGKSNNAIWRLSENENMKSGVPNFLRTAMLVKHDKDSLDHSFTISVDVIVQAEFSFTRVPLRRTFKSKDQDLVRLSPQEKISSDEVEEIMKTKDRKMLDKVNLNELISLRTA